MIARLSRSNEA